MNTAGYKFLDLSDSFVDNIKRKADVNKDVINVNIRENKEVLPKFRYYNDDRNLNLTSKFMPDYIHKNKSIFPPEKPIQTEQDQIGVNVPFLDSYYGYKDYGNFKVGILPEIHKTTFKSSLFDVIY